MLRQKHYDGLNHLYLLACSTHRRAGLFHSERFRRRWVRTLEELRHELNFKIIGHTHGSNSAIAYIPKGGTYAPPAEPGT